MTISVTAYDLNIFENGRAAGPHRIEEYLGGLDVGVLGLPTCLSLGVGVEHKHGSSLHCSCLVN